MKLTRAIVGAVFATVVGLSAAWADAPNLLTYQGRILESGVLVNGSRNVTISICNALTGGSCDSTGTQSVSVNNGLFRTTFTAPTSGTNALTGTGNRYIEVNVGGTVLSPREQLTSAPFAAVAGFVNAGNVGTGVLGTGVTVNPGAIGTGTLGSSVVVSPGQLGTGMITNPVNFSGKVGIGSSNPGGTLELAAFGSGGVHLRAVQGTLPAIGTPSNCGPGSGATVTTGSTDMAGSITINTGSSGPTTCDTIVTFNQPYGGVPKMILLTPRDSGAAGKQGFVSAVTSNSFTVSLGGVPNTSQGYVWYYFVVE